MPRQSASSAGRSRSRQRTPCSSRRRAGPSAPGRSRRLAAPMRAGSRTPGHPGPRTQCQAWRARLPWRQPPSREWAQTRPARRRRQRKRPSWVHRALRAMRPWPTPRRSTRPRHTKTLRAVRSRWQPRRPKWARRAWPATQPWPHRRRSSAANRHGSRRAPRQGWTALRRAFEARSRMDESGLSLSTSEEERSWMSSQKPQKIREAWRTPFD